jgi:hypothetical protein
MFRRLLVICALGLIFPASANAAEPPAYPGQRTAALPELRTMIHAGVGFWAQRNVTIAEPVELLVADDVGDAQDGLGETPFSGEVFGRSIAARDYGVNRIVLRADWAREMLREMRDRVVGRVYAAHACAVLWHELGHIGGLANPQFVDGRWIDGHPASGLMSQSLEIPGDCQVLARRLSRASSSSSRPTPESVARRPRRTQRLRSRLAQRRQRAASRAYRRAVLRSEAQALRHAKRARG